MRRLHVQAVAIGPVALDAAEAHHARDVLRLREGAEIEVFDGAGRVGRARIVRIEPRDVVIEVWSLAPEDEAGWRWTVASAVPKGARADWMIEKLSELGTSRFIPLATARSVVRPEGSAKRGRWERLSAESAKQSRRRGVMRIGELTELRPFLNGLRGAGWYLSTEPGAVAAWQAVQRLWSERPAELTICVGPEGGWSDEENSALREAGLTAVSLGATILRVETAAVSAAAILAAMPAPIPDRKDP